MRFLIDANLPRALGRAISSIGHEAVDCRDILPANAPDSVIAAYAREHGLCILTMDFDFADIRAYPPAEYHGIVVFEAAPGASYRSIVQQVLRCISDADLVTRIPRSLSIVSPASVRVREG